MKLLIILLAVWLGVASAAEPRRNLTVEKSAAAEKRVALVIGNAAYKSGPLVNPVNDARAIANRLRSLGFDIVLRENLKQREIGGVYREFRSKIAPGGVALVFYAGHGVQFKGQNYFPATDADISSEEDVPLQSLNLGNLLDNMEEAKAGVSLVFLDACRDNPFARRFRSASRGLAKVEAASGTLIHYATRPGSVASDGEGQNGTYTEALLAQMSEPDIPVELMLKRVANSVVAKTKGKQEPWVEGSLRGDFYFRPLVGATFGAAPQLAVPVDLTAVEISFWESIKSSTDAEDFQAYLDKYPGGQFVALAERRVKKKPAKVDEPVKALALPKEGDFWRYRGSNQNGPDAPTYRVSRVSGDKVELRYATNINEQIILTLNSDWNPISQLGQKGASDISFVPFAPQYQFPLVAGKKWRAHYKGECGVLCSFEAEYESEVRGWEKITVPAGTFDALRIDSRETFRHAFGVTSIGTGSIWLAPEVKNPVKFDYMYSGKWIKDYELEAYQVAK